MKIIKYKFLSCQVNHGTEEMPEYEDIFLNKEVFCKTEAAFQANLVTAQAEAYKGEYTVDEEPDEATEATTDDVLNALLGVSE